MPPIGACKPLAPHAYVVRLKSVQVEHSHEAARSDLHGHADIIQPFIASSGTTTETACRHILYISYIHILLYILYIYILICYALVIYCKLPSGRCPDKRKLQHCCRACRHAEQGPGTGSVTKGNLCTDMQGSLYKDACNG